jgi:NAD(P)-dependent dehydrogenase (short-subunit alcohol dehydrogenase family)
LLRNDYYLDKTAMVTGGARGIGRAIVKRFLSEGVRVVVCDVNPDGMDDLLKDESIDSAMVLPIVGDIRRAEEIVEQVAAAGWRVDYLVNNAALAPRIPSSELSREVLNDILDVNVTSAFELSRILVERTELTNGGLIIVNISSVNAWLGIPEMAHYNASKAALLSITRTLAVEWAPLGVRVNAVCPGSTWTESWEEGGWGAEDRARFASKNPLGRFATPDEIAGAVLFLTGPDASFITGHGLVADGGLTAAV